MPIKRIGIDARFYGPIGKGLGRYTQEIVDNIIKIDQDNEYVVFLGKDNFDQFKCDSIRVKKVLANVRWYTLAEQLLFPLYIFKERLDLIHFPHFNVPIFCPTKFIVTIHDLILINFPTARATTLGPLLYKIKNLAYRLTIWLAAKRARKIIAVSEFTKTDIVNHFKIKPEKIIVTYEGVANLAKGRDTLFDSRLDDKKMLEKYNILRPYLLYVGNAYPHKNLEGLVDVFAKLRKENDTLQLVLVGKEDYFYKRIKDHAAALGLWREGEDSPIIFTGYVSDAEMEVLFKNGLAYVFASFYEGFGLPPLEAMAKGLPVVSSGVTSMPEILGEAAIYFNPDDQEDMLAKLKTILGDGGLRRQLTARGYAQVKKYSWWECGLATYNIYQNILK